MVKIAICDDSRECLESIKQHTRQYLAEKAPELDCELDAFLHPDELLCACEKKKYHLFLLDIMMPMVDGVQAAKEIQQDNPMAFFVFCTSSRKYPLDAYSVNAIHYLTKPISYADFTGAMDRFMARFDSGARGCIRITDSTGGDRDFQVKEILYIEAARNCCRIQAFSGNLQSVHISMIKMAENLSGYPMLIKMGASYILNLENVWKIDGNEVILKNRERLYIPRGNASEIRKQFMAYYS